MAQQRGQVQEFARSSDLQGRGCRGSGRELAQTLELAKQQLQMMHPLADNAWMEIKSNLVAADARVRHLIAKAELERQLLRQAAFTEKKASAAGG